MWLGQQPSYTQGQQELNGSELEDGKIVGSILTITTWARELAISGSQPFTCERITHPTSPGMVCSRACLIPKMKWRDLSRSVPWPPRQQPSHWD
ncbi:hypothetical protein Y1Q_0023653 [Alligator mississippiensis]|uniref:Uncharacterized protein n=1 Tax=Alligator mississippiensis TaxID=8496 RepID=A0A151MMU3_ALLMI|nr:hypothetical protein Y1Q_0023653 [Alligator mississippiensis]